MKFLKIKEEIMYLNQRYNVQRNIEDLFMECGYTIIEPSYFEDYDEFFNVNKRMKKESMVKVLNSFGNVLILRPDITTSIIKKVMPMWEEGLKLKLFYSSTVFKNKPNSRIDEFKQVGIEHLGESSYKSDYEVIELALKILSQYKEKFILELGTSKYLNGLLRELNLGEDVEKDLKILIYNKNQFELISFIEKLKLNEEINELLENLLSFEGDFDQVLLKAKSYYINEDMITAINELEYLKKYIEQNGNFKNTYFDLSMVASFDYYQGIIFKGYYPNIYQPILSGGRYDHLIEKAEKNVPAVGFSIDINQLMKVVYKEDI